MKTPKEMRSYKAEWARKNPEVGKNWIKNNPWYSSYKSARYRCLSPKGDYYPHVKFNMTVADFKFLWFRDKAYNMRRPSIDRIESGKDYTLDNCQFMELSENSRKRVYYYGKEWIERCGNAKRNPYRQAVALARKKRVREDNESREN